MPDGRARGACEQRRPAAWKQEQRPGRIDAPWTPALAAAMASWLGMPWRATAEEQNAMEPPPGCRIMALTAGRRMLKQLKRLVRSVWGRGRRDGGWGWGGGGAGLGRVA